MSACGAYEAVLASTERYSVACSMAGPGFDSPNGNGTKLSADRPNLVNGAVTSEWPTDSRYRTAQVLSYGQQRD